MFSGKKIRLGVLTLILAIGIILGGCSPHSEHNEKQSSEPIKVVTSTDFYSEVAKAVVGNKGTVSAIINKPSMNPHDYEPTPNVAKEVHGADVVVANGVGYDTWMNKLADGGNDTYIKVGNDLLGKKDGDNPHLWYLPSTMPILANALAKQFAKKQPENKKYFERNAEKYVKSLSGINDEIEKIKKMSLKINQKQVYVSEPVFDYAVNTLGFRVANKIFEMAVENQSDPAPKAISKMQDGLKKHQVAFLVFNKQVDSKTVNNLVDVAKKNNVPVLPVTETLPANEDYAEWMTNQYKQLAQILH